ncbi:hypothetical protein SAMN02746066_03768 [Anaerosporobacter mobilis DSM 15930]|uniref:Uncharacterized protein n=1 Tax=Anaerosporobacter mobilis DSM 15930 TaxID=1120996 RepID=A0A1M7MDB1_9FIRM|nr:DUF5702 domain-containing protein [Anaerosporobacter mobilis]SHM88728.1 hypothetical protein SAMN02746066_03768 [Anaerosporobacter mobilis DSM 15930]
MRKQQLKLMTYNKEKQASITVYLTLILLLVVAILCTVVESARINGARGIGKSALTASVDSFYSLYQRELYDTYRIFGYNLNGESGKTAQEQIIEEISTYMEDNLKGIELDTMEVSNIAMLTDYEGEIFLNQVLSFMKYSALGEVIKEVLEKLNLYESSEDTSEVMEKKLATQESLGELSKDMLKLMSQVEGVDTDENGVRVTKAGTIKVKNTFAKRIVAKAPSMQALGINKEIIYNSLSNKYFNISLALQNSIEYCDKAVASNKEIERLKKQKEKLEKEKSELEETIANQSKQSKKGDPEDGNTKDEEGASSSETAEEKQLKEVEAVLTTVSASIQEENKSRDKYITLLKDIREDICDASINTGLRIEDALNTISRIEGKSKEIAKEVDGYEEVVEGKKDKIGEELYKEFQEDIVDMKEYIGMQDNSDSLSTSSVISMRPTLIENEKILGEIYTKSSYSITKESESLEGWKKVLQSNKDLLVGYQVSTLRFDYSTLVIEPEIDSPVDHIYSLFTDGILSLVVDDINSISDGSIKGENLPSLLASVEPEESGADCESILEGCKDNQYNSDITNSFALDNSFVNDLVEQLLLNQYQMDFFNEFTQCDTQKADNNSKLNEENAANSKETSSETKAGDVQAKTLQYELEYIISGHKTDKENLGSVATKLILLRTLMNFVYVYTDKEKNATAYATAAALVGFTCLAPLVTLIKTVILFVWAMVEALVDTYALLDGRSVPLFKSKSTFKVTYNDLISMSKKNIAGLASKYPKDQGKIGEFTYSNYLRLFLIMNGTRKNCYRSMDIIQMNMQKVLGDGFYLSNCIFGMEVQAYMKLPEQFITFPFMKRILGETEGYYSFRVRAIDAY